MASGRDDDPPCVGSSFTPSCQRIQFSLDGIQRFYEKVSTVLRVRIGTSESSTPEFRLPIPSIDQTVEIPRPLLSRICELARVSSPNEDHTQPF